MTPSTDLAEFTEGHEIVTFLHEIATESGMLCGNCLSFCINPSCTSLLALICVAEA